MPERDESSAEALRQVPLTGIAHSRAMVTDLALPRPDPTVRFSEADCGEVLYACYGSNLSLSSFDNYLVGCRDDTTPSAVYPIELPFDLSFGEEGAAFLHNRGEGRAVGAGWHVTREQFLDTMEQENWQDLGTGRLDGVLHEALDAEDGEANVVPDHWYGKLVYLGAHEGLPVFTFTIPQVKVLRPPDSHYSHIICQGLRDVVQWDYATSCEYLVGYPGAEGRWTQGQLLAAVEAEEEFSELLADDDEIEMGSEKWGRLQAAMAAMRSSRRNGY